MRAAGIGIAVVTAVMMAGCGPNLNTFSTPTPVLAQSPFITQFGGFYNGSLTLARVSGGECTGDEFLADVGTVDVGTVVITQAQTDITAVIRSATTGSSNAADRERCGIVGAPVGNGIGPGAF